MIARASEWTSKEVASAVGGQLLGDAARPIAGVATDTRDALFDQLFVALAGERFDAHDFLDQAVAGGAAALLVRRGLAASDLARWSQRAAIVEVDDTLHALGELARAHRARLRDLRVVALTGSNGKTSTKEMLAAIAETAAPTVKTLGNLNNLIGLPMTVLGANRDHAIAVLEMGMNSKGEIARLTEIAAPDVGMVINVGPAHIGELGSMEAIALAKGELYAGLDANAVAVVNADDPHVVRVARFTRARRSRTFGVAPRTDVRLLDRTPSGEGQRIELEIDGVPRRFELAYPGAHNALNAAAAVAAATAVLELSPDQIAAGLARAARVAGRLMVEPLGPYWLVDDCYNANAASMLAAIDTLRDRVVERGGRLVALLGEMRELGSFSAEEHSKVGRALGERGAAIAASFGPDAEPIARGARESGVAEVRHEAEDVDALAGWVLARLVPGDVILVKGSRGIRMERFIGSLKEAVR